MAEAAACTIHLKNRILLIKIQKCVIMNSTTSSPGVNYDLLNMWLNVDACSFSEAQQLLLMLSHPLLQTDLRSAVPAGCSKQLTLILIFSRSWLKRLISFISRAACGHTQEASHTHCKWVFVAVYRCPVPQHCSTKAMCVCCDYINVCLMMQFCSLFVFIWISLCGIRRCELHEAIRTFLTW